MRQDRRKTKTNISPGGGRGMFKCFSSTGAKVVDDDKDICCSPFPSSVSRSESFESSGLPLANDQQENGRRKRTRPYRKIMSKIVGSVAFVSYLDRSRKEHHEIYKNSLDQNLPQISPQKSTPSTSTSTTDDERQTYRIVSSSSSFSSSSSSSSSISVPAPMPDQKLHLLPPQLRPKPMTEKTELQARRNFVSANSVFLFVLGLFIVVFCGRLLAILFTCTCLYFIPRRNAAVKTSTDSLPPTTVALPPCRSDEEEKKRVVLVGLLNRPKKLQVRKEEEIGKNREKKEIEKQFQTKM